MKQLVLLFTALVLSSLSFAGSVKNSSSLSQLGTSWKAVQTHSLQPGQDINIVYGGEDLSRKSAIRAATVIA